MLPIFFDQQSLHVFKEVDCVFDQFPVDQRIYLYAAIVCNSNLCTLFLGRFCMLFFLQNAFSSEFIVGNWFSIPHSTENGLPSEPNYNLFFNYREIVEWEYVTYTHFIFLIFFAVILKCPNAIMLFILVPTFVTTMAGIYSNVLSNACVWPRIALPILYFLAFVSNALTYRDVCRTFSNRANDRTFVQNASILEVSHEFLHMSDISDAAMQLCCRRLKTEESDRLECMMWLLQKQRLEVESLRHEAINAVELRLRDVPVMKYLESEFKPRSKGKLASLCRMSRCDVEFKLRSYKGDPTVRSREPELRHFLCSFMFSVLTSVSKRIPDGMMGLLRFCVDFCGVDNLDKVLKDHALQVSKQRSLRLATPADQSAHASPVPSDLSYVQVVVELVGTQPSASSATSQDLSWLASFGEPLSDNMFLQDYCALEYISRMQGSLYKAISQRETIETMRWCCSSSSQNKLEPSPDDAASATFIAAFALPCSNTIETSAPRPLSTFHDSASSSNITSQPSSVELPAQPLSVSTTPLRILIVEDQLIIALRFKRDLKESPLTAHYVVDHAPNVAQAMLMFRNRAQPVPGQTGSDGANAAYHVVLLDNQMPMADGGSIDEDAGVRLLFISCLVLFACVLMCARGWSC